MLNNYDGQPGMEKPLAVGLGIALVGICMAITWTLSQSLDQTVLALILAFVLSMLALVAPLPAIATTFIFLAIMGDVRRLMGYYIGSVRYDVLLLVGPIVASLLFVTAAMRGKLEMNNRLGWWMTILTLLMFVQIFNPQQGGLIVGIGGAFYYIIPIFWFWIGQVHGRADFLHMLLYKIVVPVAVLAGLLGCYQTWIGFPDYQYNWLLNQSNIAVNVNGRVRPFGFFVSPPEYALYCGLASAILVSGVVIKRFHVSQLLAPFLFFCCFMQGGRTPLLGTLAGLTALWSLKPRAGETRLSIPRVALATTVLFGGLMYSMFLLKEADLGEEVAPMVGYQVQGFTNMGESSAGAHAELFYTGILSSLTQPAGLGLGATTSAATKMGVKDGVAWGTEIDLSNMFVSLGPLGGILYLIVMVLIARMLIQYVRRTGHPDALAVMGVSICIGGHWLNGGHYAVTSLLWFCFGVINRLNTNWELDHPELLPAPAEVYKPHLAHAPQRLRSA